MARIFKIMEVMEANQNQQKNQQIQQSENSESFFNKLIDRTSDLFRDTLWSKSHEKSITIDYFKNQMENASSYKEWFDAATNLDQLEGNASWIEQEESDEYDWKLLKSKTNEIRNIRETKKNRLSMIFALRSCLTRNFGDMGNSNLFTHSHVGSKQIISDYIDEVIKQLNWISEESENLDLSSMDLKFKHEYFMTLRQNFGRTALLLSGGGTLGLHHFGILKALINARLLPRIISGASCGSIISAIICTKNEEERKALINGPWSLSLNVFESPDDPDTAMRRLKRLITEGHLYDSSHLVNVLREAIGDVTFQEAYNRSRLILNISVSSSTTYEMPSLLNYLTAPDVIIWSAVAASCSVPLIYSPIHLYMRGKDGEIIPWSLNEEKYCDGSLEVDIPLKRLSELFNVNHFIVSQANPHVAPFLQKDNSRPSAIRKTANFCLGLAVNEIKHRCTQLDELGLSFKPVAYLQSVLSQKYVGHINIAPKLGYNDFLNVMANPTVKSIESFVKRGEKSTWPKMSMIQQSLKIELAIDRIIYKLRLKLLESQTRTPISVQEKHEALVSPHVYSTHMNFEPSSSSSSCSDKKVSNDDDYDFDDGITVPATPLWQTFDIYDKLSEYSDKDYLVVMEDRFSNTIAASRRKSDAPSANNDDTTNRFERRKQIKSTQFFLAPDFAWNINGHVNNNTQELASPPPSPESEIIFIQLLSDISKLSKHISSNVALCVYCKNFSESRSNR